MKVSIPYGETSFDCTLPKGSASLSITEPDKHISVSYFHKTVTEYLNKLQLDFTRTYIVVADKTRVCGYPTYLPILVNILEESGLDTSALRFIIAYGTHPRQSDEECRACYGKIYSQYPFIHHDCHDSKAFVQLGRTTRGVPVRLRKDLSEATCIITMGPICHHYFAGYGGGRKLLFPGCGEKEAIYANHGLYLDHENQTLASQCQPGILHGNPLAEDLFEISCYRQADFAVHGIMNSHGELCDILIGSDKESYLQACESHAEYCETSAPQFPLVIASCGGFPKDINYIQTHKGMHNAAMFVEDGGMLILFSECVDSIGSSTFLPWFEKGGFPNAFRDLQSNYQGNGGTALATMTKTSRITICMVTELSSEFCNTINVQKMHPRQALCYIEKQTTPVCFIGNASLLVRKTVGTVSA